MDNFTQALSITGSKYFYKYLIKNVLFKLEADKVHTRIQNIGEKIGKNSNLKKITKSLFLTEYPSLRQEIHGIKFMSPVGLAAGFDYEARLTQSLSILGFGYQTIGTITNKSYEGNPKPMLGRLPKSKSLMVNKGFKNPGAKKIIGKLSDLEFEIPLGISIGVTNNRKLTNLSQNIADILHAFILFEGSGLKNSYYELNISCPNIYNKVSFYGQKNLKTLLEQIDLLKVKKPIFIKMPICISDDEIEMMLKTIAKYSPKGVIFGNLQKNRKNPSLYPEEVSKFKTGNFSGRPTFFKSNDLIKLTYKNYKDRFTIIGCGGVFNAKDAFIKIANGASLIQLITGLIFEGPQLAADINMNLAKLLQRKGFKNIKDAIGSNL